MTDAVAEYLKAMTQIHASGHATDETSYYDALAGLLNRVGEGLSPQVRCILTLKNKGAGIPDGGLFTAPQLRSKVGTDLSAGANPAGGAMEVKPLSQEVKKIAASEQVDRYLDKYGQVLVTNYRDFLLVGRDRHGRKIDVDTHQLATSENTFWTAARTHEKTAKRDGPALVRFLRRTMVRPAPITTPEDLAKVLAWYAQEALARVEQSPPGALESFKTSLEEALGITFEDKKSLHFFHSTLVQTLFYGIFSGWVIWSRDHDDPDDHFDWRTAAWTVHLPALRSLFAEAAKPGRIQLMGVHEVLDWTAEALARVDRKAFFKKFESRFAIQYFYEPFLENFDPVLRKDLGVWYTPPEVVHYMVERIDRVLREELGLENGFADENVYVLDPCVGTGSFLVEVLRRIEKTLKEGGEDEFVGSELRRAAMERVLGFEIMPAPFVVAHLQVGLLLQTLGAPLDTAKDERAAIFLTNSLTGWEPPKGPQKKLSFIELQEEKEAADRVKRETPILVVLGNPPYNAYAGVAPTDAERRLVEDYKKGLKNTWGLKKYNLDELYARFMRIAERQIAEHTKKGVICYISSYSYLSDPSFVILRERLLQNFDKAWIDSLNGDSRETGKRTPDGLPDPSVFSTERNREGIQLGTSIGLFVKKDEPAAEKQWRYRDFWGATKREDLVASLKDTESGDYKLVEPRRENHFNFRPSSISSSYLAWPTIMALVKTDPCAGMHEMRGMALISIDREPLVARMKAYFDRGLLWEDLDALGSGLTRDAAMFDAMATRRKAQRLETYTDEHVFELAYRPFDNRPSYFSAVQPLWNRHRPEIWSSYRAESPFLVARRYGAKSLEGVPFFWTSRPVGFHLLKPNAAAIPIRLASTSAGLSDFQDGGASAASEANLSGLAREYLATLNLHDDDIAREPDLLWSHTLAIGFSPKYLQENRDGIKQDWPRIPLPKTAHALRVSAELGRRIADLLDAPIVVGVNKAPIRPELHAIGKVLRVGGGPFDPSQDLELTMAWGRPQQGGVFPGPGKAALRDYAEDELEYLEKGGLALGMDLDEMKALLGEQTYDVYLNEDTYWCNVPQNVWDYHIGGYQVIKKWLSYRELVILGRPLKAEEAKEVREMARRIAAILLMQPELNANYRAVEKAAFVWPPKRRGVDKLPIQEAKG